MQRTPDVAAEADALINEWRARAMNIVKDVVNADLARCEEIKR